MAESLNCSVNDQHCKPNSRLRKGLCDVHYARLRRHGDPLHRERHRDRGPEHERWLAKVRLTPFGCWEWTAGQSHTGYGQHGKHLAHIYVWELLVGPVPPGLELDHLCRNTLCVSPEHLEPVTHAENVRRGRSGRWQLAKTHCGQGHKFSPENTYVPPRGGRSCRECTRQKVRDYMRRRRAQERLTANR